MIASDHRLRNESGQALVVTALFMGVRSAAPLTIDVGSWYRQHRAKRPDAALSRASAREHTQATSVSTYCRQEAAAASTRPAALPSAAISANDTVAVNVTRTHRLLLEALRDRLDQVRPTALAQPPGRALRRRWSSASFIRPLGPVPVLLLGHDDPARQNGLRSFAIVDLSAFVTATGNDCGASPNGNTGSKTVADWILHGFDGYLQLGCYDSDPGAKFDSQDITSAMQARIGTNMLFPVFNTLTNQGSNAQYVIIGWAAFHVEAFAAQGNTGSVPGYFTNVIWDGIQSATAPSGPAYGVHSIALVN